MPPEYASGTFVPCMIYIVRNKSTFVHVKFPDFPKWQPGGPFFQIHIGQNCHLVAYPSHMQDITAALHMGQNCHFRVAYLSTERFRGQNSLVWVKWDRYTTKKMYPVAYLSHNPQAVALLPHPVAYLSCPFVALLAHPVDRLSQPVAPQPNTVAHLSHKTAVFARKMGIFILLTITVTINCIYYCNRNKPSVSHTMPVIGQNYHSKVAYLSYKAGWTGRR